MLASTTWCLYKEKYTVENSDHFIDALVGIECCLQVCVSETDVWSELLNPFFRNNDLIFSQG